jgi:uncharacterized protein (DUF2252 family)
LGGKEERCEESVLTAVKSYRKHMREYAFMGNMELHYSRIDMGSVLSSLPLEVRLNTEKLISKARSHTHVQVLEKLTDIIDKKHLLREHAPFIVRETHTEKGRSIKEALGLLLESYFQSLADDRKNLLKHYRIVDVVRKVVGVGSVGTRCWVIFLKGNHDGDPLFLQVKQAQASVLQPFVTTPSFKNQGERVVAGQRLIQGAPDIFLGWGEQDGVDFYIRQLRDMKGGLEFDPEKMKVKNYPLYTSLCGKALALAHARSGDAAMLAGYVGNSDVLDKAMVRFGFSYAFQTEKDFQALADAAKSGRITVASESE